MTATPDTLARAIGTPLDRIEGREKVTGAAKYAYEYQAENMAYAEPVQAQIAKGAIRSVDTTETLAQPGVIAVIWNENAPKLADDADGELALFQSRRVAYRGQYVAAVVAETPEAAREGQRLLRMEYDEESHDVLLREGHPKLYTPEKVNPNFPAELERGDPDGALASAAVSVDVTYRTPAFHNNPMEPHATTALWQGGDLILYDSNQGAPANRDAIAGVFDLPPERVRVISPHVGGGFGSKGTPRPNAVLAAIAAKVVERPVKVAVTRQQMFAVTGYRTPTIQRMRLAADADGTLTAISHEVVEQTSTLKEFAEQTAVVTRVMYAAPNRRTAHKLARLDVPTPSWMRAPGECPGMYALESAMDELAVAAGIDPIELRARNDSEVEPESGRPFSSRNLVGCLREGAERFGWAGRDPTPGARRDGKWLIGTGVASSTYPAYRRAAQASARAEPDGTFTVRVGAADIGTGARTALTQIAADALGTSPANVHVEIGDSALPKAGVAGGSMGTASWGTAVHRACRALLSGDGNEAEADTSDEIEQQKKLARHGFGAQFAEVRVDSDSGEVRVPRLLGVFAVGRIINPKTARSQFIGGMTMGMGMALFEESVMDAEFGDYLNRDLAQYHVPACADVHEIEAAWLDEDDDELNPMGSKGIGEIGIVGTAAAIGNAVYHATGKRVRELPIRLDRLID